MKDRKLATRYARALFTALPEPASAESADTFLTALVRALSRSPELQGLLANPAIPRRAKTMVLAKLADAHGAPRLVKSFLAVLVDQGRTSHLQQIAEAFHAAREAGLGIVNASITAALPLSAEVEERARVALRRMTGREVRLAVGVDPDLLGGAVTRIGSMVYDGSVRTQLANLRRRMAGE